MNRIESAISRMRDNIASRLATGLVTQDKVNKLHTTLDMDAMEHAMFQTRKSLAFASGKMSLDEATTLYRLLGESPATFNRQPIEVKSVLTQAFAELIGAR